MAASQLVGQQVGIAPACAALGVSRATWYRRHQDTVPPIPGRARRSPRRLSESEQAEVIEVLHSSRFCDHAPAQVVYTLMDEDERYLCSESTMYRLLRQRGEVRERRDQLRHPKRAVPRLSATAPNQVWTWDLTKLRTTVKYRVLYLYVMLDLYSRYAVAWLLAWKESGELAKDLLREAIKKYDLDPDQLTLHADRGSAPTAKTLAELMVDLGVTASHSRPRVSNDNPYSESQFKTLKSMPDFPGRFEDEQQARGFCRGFFDWYNLHHRHSGIAYFTRADAFFGRTQGTPVRRSSALEDAFRRHPERFVRGQPAPHLLPTKVEINPVNTEVIDSSDLL